MKLFRRKSSPERAEIAGIELLGPINEWAVAFEAATSGETWTVDGDFALHEFAGEIYPLTPYAQILAELNGTDFEEFWTGASLEDQWEDAARDEREAAFHTAIQFQNMYDTAWHEAANPDVSRLVTIVHVTARLKAPEILCRELSLNHPGSNTDPDLPRIKRTR